MNVTEIRTAIMNVDNHDDLKAIFRAYKERFGQLEDQFAREASATLQIGSQVWFDAKTRGIITGKIVKINRKTVKVKADKTNMVWNVSTALIRSDFGGTGLGKNSVIVDEIN